jgi:hypothetical protein
MKFLIEKRINVYENNDKRNVLIGNDIFIINDNELIKRLVGPDGCYFSKLICILATLILLFKS